MNKTRIAVIGVGALGRHHARILSGFDDVELVGVVDAREDQGRQIATQHQTQWFRSAEQVLEIVDGVVIAVPTVAHLNVARPFLEAEIPVLMEKPLAASLSESRELHALAQRSGTLLQVGHVERFNPAFEHLRTLTSQPLNIRCQRVSPYTFRSTDIGVVHDLMIHDIDLALSLCGSSATVESVDSFGAVTIGPHEDMAVTRLRMSTGVIIDLTASRMCPAAERSIQIWAADGFFSADLQTRKVTSWQPAPMLRQNPGLVHLIAQATPNPLSLKDEVFTKWMQKTEVELPAQDALTAELKDFVTAIRTGTQPRVTSTDALRAMDVADRVLSSLTLWSYQTGSSHSQIRHAA